MPRLEVLALGALFLAATEARDVSLRRLHSGGANCCILDNDIWTSVFQSRIFASLTSLDVDLPSMCFVLKEGLVTFLRHMPNLKAARIHHSYLPDWTAYLLEPTYKLCSLSLVGRGTYVELRFFNTLLRRCLSLQTFEYCASQGMQGWELDRLLDMILRLRRTSRLPFLHRVALCARGKAPRPTCGKVQALTAEQVQVVVHSMVER